MLDGYTLKLKKEFIQSDDDTDNEKQQTLDKDPEDNIEEDIEEEVEQEGNQSEDDYDSFHTIQ